MKEKQKVEISTLKFQEDNRKIIKGKWVVLLQILTFIIILLFLNPKQIFAKESTGSIYGPLVSDLVNAQIKSEVNTKTPKLVEISDDQGKKFISKKFGNRIASRILHRVKVPLAKQHPEIRYTKSTTQTSSSNWSGYIAQSSNIQGVAGEFNVAPSQNGEDSTWTGIGGVNGTGNLAQTGIDQSLMAAWTEIFPAPAQFWFYVNNGDQIVSNVLYDSDTGYWFLLIGDLTTGDGYYNEYSFNPDQTTAEWIVERVGNADIGTFNTVNFGSSYWYDSNNTKQNINSDIDNVLYQTILPWNGQLATPLNIGLDGESFSIVSNSALLPLGILDSPTAGLMISGTINVGGWYLDGNVVSKVEVLVDGVVKGQATYGDARADVYTALPAYNNH